MCIPNELKPEKVIDQWFDLDLPENLKSKYKDVLDEIIGNVHLRLYYSVDKETPFPVPNNSINNFLYESYLNKMKNGDLILYDGIGCLDSVTKIYSGSQYSRIGIILKMPNRFTKKPKLYVAEITRNVGNFLDAYKQVGNPGLNIFRLKERLHYINATSIWWSPLKVPIDNIAGEQNMLDWMKGVSSNTIKLDDMPSLPPEIVDFFDNLEIQLTKHPYAVEEMNSAFIAIQALRLSGKRYPFDYLYNSPVKVLVNDYFEEPILLRERTIESGSETATLAQSRAEKRYTVIKKKAPTDKVVKEKSTVENTSLTNSDELRKRSNTQLPPKVKKLDRSKRKSSAGVLSHRKVTSDTDLRNGNDDSKLQKKHSRIFSADNSVNTQPRETREESKSDVKEEEIKSKQSETVEKKPLIRNYKIRPPSESLDSLQIQEMKSDSSLNLSITSPRVKELSQQESTNSSEKSPLKENIKSNENGPVEEIKESNNDEEKHVASIAGENSETLAKPKKKKKKETGSKSKSKKKKSSDESKVKKVSSRVLKSETPLKGKVKWDFNAENDGEVNCKEGDILEIIDHTSDPDWMIVKSNGVHGCIPKSFVDILS